MSTSYNNEMFSFFESEKHKEKYLTLTNEDLQNVFNKKEMSKKEWEKYFRHLFPNSNGNYIMEALLMDKNIPIETLLETIPVKHITCRHFIWQREDLTKNIIKAYIGAIGSKEARSELTNKDIVIHPNNLKIMCEMSKSELAKIHFEPFSRIQELPKGKTIYDYLEKFDNHELLLTAIANNNNLPNHIREKCFGIAYVPELIRDVTPKMADEFYPLVADVVFNKSEDVDLNTSHKITVAFTDMIKNNGFPDSCIMDIINRQKDMHTMFLSAPLVDVARQTRNPILLAGLLKIQQDCRFQAMENPAFDFGCLAVGDEHWFKQSQYKYYGELERKKYALRALMHYYGIPKVTDSERLSNYINERPYDAVLVKSIIMSPSTKSAMMNTIRNEFIDKLTDENKKQEYMMLMFLSEKIEDLGCAVPTQQYLIYQILQENFKQDKDIPKKVAMVIDMSKPQQLSIADYQKQNKEVPNIGLRISLQSLNTLKNAIEESMVKYNLTTEVKTQLKKAIKNIENEYNFVEFAKKYKDFFDWGNIEITFSIEKLYKQTSTPETVRAMIDDLAKCSAENPYITERFKAKFYEAINNALSDKYCSLCIVKTAKEQQDIMNTLQHKEKTYEKDNIAEER